VVRGGGGRGGEMTQALYAHMNNNNNKKEIGSHDLLAHAGFEPQSF
jgi:hypothetical protein